VQLFTVEQGMIVVPLLKSYRCVELKLRLIMEVVIQCLVLYTGFHRILLVDIAS